MAHSRLSFRIPKPHREAVEWLAELPDEHVEALESALQGVRPTMSAQRLAEQLKSYTPIEESRLGQIVEALFSLAASREHFQASVDRVASDIAADAETHGLADEPGRERLERHLRTLLRPNLAIASGAKAVNVALQGPQPYVRGRILTDLRPIFPEEDQADPIGAAVVHTLHIEASQESGLATEHFTLTTEDLRALRKVIDRALAKERSLLGVAEAAELAVIDWELDEEDNDHG